MSDKWFYIGGCSAIAIISISGMLAATLPDVVSPKNENYMFNKAIEYCYTLSGENKQSCLEAVSKKYNLKENINE